MTGEAWVSRPKLPTRYKIQVKKFASRWYLIVPHLTGSTSTPYSSWEEASGVGFRIADGLNRGDIWS